MANKLSITIILTSVVLSIASIAYFIYVNFNIYKAMQVSKTNTSGFMVAVLVNWYDTQTGCTLPREGFELHELLLSPRDGSGPEGSYIYPDFLIDGWGNPFTIEFDLEDVSIFHIISLGKDGLHGGTGANQDVVFTASLHCKEFYERQMSASTLRSNVILRTISE